MRDDYQTATEANAAAFARAFGQDPGDDKPSLREVEADEANPLYVAPLHRCSRCGSGLDRPDRPCPWACGDLGGAA